MGGEWLDAKRLHLQIEAKKLAFAERDRHVADPAFYQAPLERLLSKSYASELRSRIDPEHAVDPEEVQPHPGGRRTLPLWTVTATSSRVSRASFKALARW